jgi:hypothetical protein
MPLLLVPVLSLSCKSENQPARPTPPITPQPDQHQPNQQLYQNPTDGIEFQYPSNWKASTPKETEYRFTSPDAKSPVELTLDVPKLPWHPPGWIPIDSVRDGYVDDAKKKISNAQASNLPDPGIPDAKSHRVKITGQTNGKPAINEAALIVHNDKVYILSIETDPGSYPAAQKALDQAVATLRWTGK